MDHGGIVLTYTRLGTTYFWPGDALQFKTLDMASFVNHPRFLRRLSLFVLESVLVIRLMNKS